MSGQSARDKSGVRAKPGPHSRTRSATGRNDHLWVVPRQRLSGIDAARGIALLGMMATHIIPTFAQNANWDPTLVGLVFSGRSAALFAVLAGVGLALSTGKQTPHHGPVLFADRRAIAARALVIAAVGFALGGVEVNVAVILVNYALLFVLVLPFVGLRLKALLAWAAGWVLLSPVLGYLVRPWLLAANPPLHLDHNPIWDDVLRPAVLLGDLLFTGYYPAIQWLSYLLIGLVIGRLALTTTAVQLGLLAGGAALAVGTKWLGSYFMDELGGEQALLATDAGRMWPLHSMLQVNLTGVNQAGSWWWLATSAPHSGTTLDLLHTGTMAAAVIGFCLLLSRLGDWLGLRILLPLSGAGAMTLTLYTAHVVALSGTFKGLPPGWTPEGLYTTHALAALTIGTLFAVFRIRGPLELIGVAAAGLARGVSAGKA